MDGNTGLEHYDFQGLLNFERAFATALAAPGWIYSQNLPMDRTEKDTAYLHPSLLSKGKHQKDVHH